MSISSTSSLGTTPYGTFENLQEKATLDQSRIDESGKANLISLDQWAQLVKDVTIVDAKESGIECRDIREKIDHIATKEMGDSLGVFRPSAYVEDEYFNGSSRTKGSLMPETILLAKKANKIVGFIITQTLLRQDIRKEYGNLPENASFVTYIAVDSDAKRSGVGTKLMLAAMHKTKQRGNQYLSLEYTAFGLQVDKEVGSARIDFFNSFTKKFGIPKKIGRHLFIDRQLHVFPYYDLKNFDSDAIGNTLIAPANNKCMIHQELSDKKVAKKSNCYRFSLLAVGAVATIIVGLGMKALSTRFPG